MIAPRQSETESAATVDLVVARAGRAGSASHATLRTTDPIGMAAGRKRMGVEPTRGRMAAPVRI